MEVHLAALEVRLRRVDAGMHDNTPILYCDQSRPPHVCRCWAQRLATGWWWSALLASGCERRRHSVAAELPFANGLIYFIVQSLDGFRLLQAKISGYWGGLCEKS